MILIAFADGEGNILLRRPFFQCWEEANIIKKSVFEGLGRVVTRGKLKLGSSIFQTVFVFIKSSPYYQSF